jgi:hypothetical protein
MDYNMLTDEELLRSFIGWPLTKLEETLAARLTACLDSNAELEKHLERVEETFDEVVCDFEVERARLNRESEELSNALSACESRVSDDA